MGADDTAADDDNAGGGHAGHTAKQHAAAAIGLLQGPGADLRGELAGDFGHWGQQGQAAGAVGDGFIGDGGDARGEQVAGLLGVGGEVEVGEEDLVFAEHLALGGLGFLNLYDQVGPGEHLFGGVQNPGSGGGVVFIGEACAEAGAGLYSDVMALRLGFAGGVGGQADAVFLGFDFLGAADLHGLSSLSNLD